MADILQDFPITAPVARVFTAISTPAGLDTWWTKTSSGEPVPGSHYTLDFGAGYQWRAEVTRCVVPTEFELQLTNASNNWLGSRVGFVLQDNDGRTQVRFHHTGWPEVNEHYRISCHCWALYLRVLRRNLEHGETVPYEYRLDV